MDRLEEMYKELKGLLSEARSLNKKDITEEEKTSFNEKMTEIQELRASIEAEKKLTEGEDEVRGMGPITKEGTDHVGGDEERFSAFGEQLRAVAKAETGGGVDSRLERRISGMSESVASDGGFLVQTDFANELLKRVYQSGVLASRARRIPISPSSNGVKINAIDENNRATGSRLGGLQAYWLNEGGTKTASKPKFRQIELNLKKLIGLCHATDELLMDTNALGSIISDGFVDEFEFMVDDAILSGDGVGKPLGILNSGATITVAPEGGQGAGTVVAENIIKMWSRAWGRGRANSVWLYNQEIEPQLHQMSLAVGTGGVPVYMPAGGLSGAPYSTLYGRPAIPVEHASALGDKGDIVLADLNQYLMADKGGIQSAHSIHVKFETDEQTFRFVYRVDGQPIWNAPLTPYKGSATLSPFVTLDNRH